MKGLTKILGFTVAALIVVALGFYFIEVYAPSPANPTLSAAIQQDSIPIGSMTREFLEYVPHDISPHSPLVIVLHGALMDAKSMHEWTGYEFDQLADQHGFVVVYPDGYKHNWNDCHSKATFAAHTENIDDMGFVKGLIAREVAQRQIDEKHVYVLGYSNGGQIRTIPGCEHAYILATGPEIGTRESRHVNARYQVTTQDIENGARFDDVVCLGAWPIEYHTEPGQPAVWRMVHENSTYDIPLRTLCSKDTPNLFVGGRLTDGDSYAGGSLRVMGTSFGTGHAAGVAAAVYAQSQGSEYILVQKELVRQNAHIKP